MPRIASLHDRLTAFLSGRIFESLGLLVVRVGFAGIFWRSGRSKIEEGSWFDIADSTYFLFEHEYSGVPLLSPEIAAPMATLAEHVFPALLVAGLATRFSAMALLVMTLVIQVFVYPDAWWTVHVLWVGMALVLVSRGAGLFSLDALIAKMRR